jgi:hypothetical protein
MLRVRNAGIDTVTFHYWYHVHKITKNSDVLLYYRLLNVQIKRVFMRWHEYNVMNKTQCLTGLPPSNSRPNTMWRKDICENPSICTRFITSVSRRSGKHMHGIFSTCICVNLEAFLVRVIFLNISYYLLLVSYVLCTFIKVINPFITIHVNILNTFSNLIYI